MYYNVNIKQLLRAIYLKLTTYGINEVSLKSEDIKQYIPDIKRIFDERGIQSDDLFVKTPVSEDYDRYKDYLIDVLIEQGVGAQELNKMHSFNGVIDDCSLAIVHAGNNKGTILPDSKSTNKTLRKILIKEEDYI